MFKQGERSYVFGPFRLDTSEKMLLREGRPVPLTPKAFEILAALVRRGGHLVDKDELLKAVWPDSFVEDSSLTQNIYVLRKALGDDAEEHRYIETVPRRGYRFVADVEEVSAGPPPGGSEGRAGAARAGEGPAPGALDATGAVASPPRPGRRAGRSALVAALLLLLLASAAVSYLLISKQPARGGRPPRKVESLAVLPFNSLSRRDEEEALGAGMADAIIVRLGGTGRLSVPPTGAVYKYAGREQGAAAARELGVDAVLTGAVQRSEGRVRVTAQLIAAGDGATLWSGVFDEKVEDIFAVQDSIAEQMLAELSPHLTGGGEATAARRRRHSRDPEAYQHYLTGLYFWNKSTKEGFYKAAEYFRRAIEEDPEYALAHGALADTYVMIAVYKYDRSPPREIYGKARAAAARALELDDTVVEAHAAMSKVLAFYDKDYAGAERELKRAIELDPNHASARLRYAWLLLVMGRLEEGVREMSRAQQLDPLSPITNITLGQFYVFAGRHDDALRFGRRAVELDPNNSNAHLALGYAYEEQGMFAEAIAEYESASAIEEGSGVTYGLEGLCHAYAASGRREEALRVLSRLEGPSMAGSVSPYNVALINSALGRKDLAFEWLERAAAVDDLHPAFLRYDPQLQPLKADPRFTDILRRHKLDISPG